MYNVAYSTLYCYFI